MNQPWGPGTPAGRGLDYCWLVTEAFLVSADKQKAGGSPGKPMARHHPDSSDSDRQYWRWCPRCGHELHNEKCRLRCPRCHYFLSGWDFD